jgi:hypothetical protein
MKSYRFKHEKRSFYCALCSSARQLRYNKHLSRFNYIQIFCIATALFYFSFPLMNFKGSIWYVIVWGAFEGFNKMLYRKELPCPYCGFDATWYRRDVRIARKKVEEFIKENPAAMKFHQKNSNSFQDHQ